MGVRSRIVAVLALMTLGVALCGGGVAAQSFDSSTTLPLGQVELRLGMDEDRVLGLLRAAFDVTQMEGHPGTWWVARKAAPPVRVVGSVGFTSQRLTFVSRSWGPDPETQSAANLARALHNAVRAISGSGPPRCVVAADDDPAPGFRILMECGARQLTVISSPDERFATTVHEMIGTGR
jgi:hypothetical protein